MASVDNLFEKLRSEQRNGVTGGYMELCEGFKMLELFKWYNQELCLLLFFFSSNWSAVQLVGILVPRPGIEPAPSAVKARSPNHRTAREFPCHILF